MSESGRRVWKHCASVDSTQRDRFGSNISNTASEQCHCMLDACFRQSGWGTQFACETDSHLSCSEFARLASLDGRMRQICLGVPVLRLIVRGVHLLYRAQTFPLTSLYYHHHHCLSPCCSIPSACYFRSSLHSCIFSPSLRPCSFSQPVRRLRQIADISTSIRVPTLSCLHYPQHCSRLQLIDSLSAWRCLTPAPHFKIPFASCTPRLALDATQLDCLLACRCRLLRCPYTDQSFCPTLQSKTRYLSRVLKTVGVPV